MNVYGYARLVGYDREFQLRPDILEAVDVVDDRVFTFHLRPGHRWSDGAPFTSEDFRYWWEDVAQNKEITPRSEEKTSELQTLMRTSFAGLCLKTKNKTHH